MKFASSAISTAISSAAESAGRCAAFIRQHAHVRQWLACITALAVVLAPMTVAAQSDDGVAKARQHYAAGKAAFDSGNYAVAIREFEAANRLAPAPVLKFNIGLSYERMGDKVEALKNYRAYLAGMPNANNRADVEQRIERLQAELRAEQFPAPASPPPPINQAPPVPNAGAQQPGAQPSAPPVNPSVGPPVGTPPPPGSSAGTGAGTQGPATAGGAYGNPPPPDRYQQNDTGYGENRERVPIERRPAASTGDPMLDRASGVDVGMVRNQRAHLMPPLPSDTAEPPAPVAEPGQEPRVARKDSKPIHRQVWFWVVVGVSAVILIDFATSGSDSGAQPLDVGQPAALGGPTLLRF